MNVTTRQYVNSPKVTVSFEVSSDDWCLIQQSESWKRIECFVDRTKRERAKREIDGANTESRLRDYKTCELVEELKTREGVETHVAEPYEDVSVQVNGPAIVLVIID